MTPRPLLVVLAVAALAGCGTPRPAAPEPVVTEIPPPPPAFDAVLTDDGPGRGLEPRRIVAYDHTLPGWLIEASMATLQLQPRPTGFEPDSLVLVLRTSTPALEHLALTTPTAGVATAMGDEEEQVTGSDGRTRPVPAGTYFDVGFEGRDVRVVLKRSAVELLERGGSVEWVDVFR